MPEIELAVRIYPEDLESDAWEDKARSAVYEWCHLHIAPPHSDFVFAFEDAEDGYALAAPEHLVLGEDC